MKILHFTLGPVQGFVAQARRTRDLWAGSFLLSWLSGHAMKAVMDDPGGKIEFPAVHDAARVASDPLLKSILHPQQDRPQIGSLPNRFKSSVSDTFDPETCREAVLGAWRKIAQAVWDEFAAPIADLGNRTEAIWNRQIDNFWEIAWVLDQDPEDKTDSRWLDARKNWRSHRPPIEGGDHCTIMGDWQEISGYIRAREKEKQDLFWQKFQKVEPVNKLDLREGERLCSIALIKRLFPKLSRKKLQEAIGWIPGGKPEKVGNWPSTAYMAAVHWVERAHKENPEGVRNYVSEIKPFISGGFGERATEIRCLSEAGEISKLDGNFFFIQAIENPRATTVGNGQDDTEAREKISEALKMLQESLGGKSASPFYALLLMDGDKVGALLNEMDAAEVSKALGQFSETVPKIVENNNGVTIYSGGDDVLAFLPLEDAIPAAIALRKSYLEDAFQNEPKATISAAIVFAHYHLPVRSVLEEAHHQLDDVAKEENGRDSLAIAVLQTSGKGIEWVSTWDTPDRLNPPQKLRDLAEEFRTDPKFSSRFFYNIRSRFGLLTDENHRLMEGLDAVSLLTAEYLKSREQTADRQEATTRVTDLLKVCRKYSPHNPEADQTLRIDGALLVRFLSRKGVEA